MTREQIETIEKLTSEIDDLECDTEGDEIVFSGDDADGPTVGYIKPDGSVTRIV